MEKIQAWYEVIGAEELAALSEGEKEEMQERMRRGIAQRTGGEPSAPKVPWSRRVGTRWRYGYLAGLAASTLLAVGWGWYSQQVPPQSTPVAGSTEEVVPEAQRQQINNTSTQELRLTLEEGSTVVLSPGSTLSYPAHFEGDRREVALVGDAFFDIARQPERPFLVYCGGAVAQVLGTSFWVKTTKESGAVEVAVKTGRVSVYEHTPGTGPAQVPPGTARINGVILTPNQKVVFFPKERHLVTGLVQAPTLLPSVKVPPGFAYNDTSLQEVLAELEEGYGIQIVLLSEKLKKCTFSGDLADLSLDEKLLLICKSVGATHELIGTHIVINGPGCD